MSEHYINKCSCGAVISQCRCMGNKTETIVQDGCDSCKEKVSQAKHVVQCDSCKLPLSLKKPKPEEPPNEAIKATLMDGHGNPKDYHFCDDECLRMYLNTRHEKFKSSASIEDKLSVIAIIKPNVMIWGHFIELDIAPTLKNNK